MLRTLLLGSLLAAAAVPAPAQEVKPTKPVDTAVATGATDAGGALPGPVQRPGALGPNTWFPVTELDLGTYFGTEHATGVFQFQNPNDAEIVWRGLLGSCSCAKVVVRVGDRTYELAGKSKPKPNTLVRVSKDAQGNPVEEEVQQIAIGPGEKGEVEAHLDIPNVPGPREASLDVHTTDAHLPQFRLKWHATSAKLFVVSPAEINLNKMSWNEVREFTVTVTSPLQPDFEITDIEGLTDAFEVQKSKQMEGERATWTIHGKYGPVNSDVGGGGLLKFITDVRGRSSFSLRVMALVQGPLEVKPGGFLPLGMIRQGKELTKEVVFEPNDGFKIVARKLSFEKLTLPAEFVSVSSHNDGNKLVIEFAVAANAPKGLLKGDLVVELDHPLVKEKRISFNGFVR
jgi:hypothetical protein